MLQRKRRKGFWWYSWLLVLLVGGGIGGGWYLGDQRWQEGPKDYRSTALLKADIREPYLAGVSPDQPRGVLSATQLEAQRVVRGVETLRPVMRELRLTDRWVVTEGEALRMLAESVDVDLSEGEFKIVTVRPDPAEAAEIANAVAARAALALRESDQAQREAAAQRLEEELDRERLPLRRALATATEALKAEGIPIAVTEETDLSTYMELAPVLDAQVEIESAKERLREREQKQVEERRHWQKDMEVPEVTVQAVPAVKFSGPERTPFQQQGMLYGGTIGLGLGLLLMFVFWKLFTPKR